MSERGPVGLTARIKEIKSKIEAHERSTFFRGNTSYNDKIEDIVWLIGQLESALAAKAPQGALVEAVRKLYYAAVWHADKPVDEKALWTAVRDAAGFEPGGSPKPAPQGVPTTHDLAEAIANELMSQNLLTVTVERATFPIQRVLLRAYPRDFTRPEGLYLKFSDYDYGTGVDQNAPKPAPPAKLQHTDDCLTF